MLVKVKQLQIAPVEFIMRRETTNNLKYRQPPLRNVRNEISTMQIYWFKAYSIEHARKNPLKKMSNNALNK